jgi:DNA-binding CsgD family transcriptional regulator
VSVTFSPGDLRRMESAAEALLSPFAHERVDDWRRTVTRTIKKALDCDGAMFTLVPVIEPGAEATFSEDGCSGELHPGAPPHELPVFDEEQFAGMQAACRSSEGLGVVVVTREKGAIEPFSEKALAMLQLLQPALAVGIEMRQRFARRRAEFLRVLDAMREGLMLVEANGRILHETPAIERVLADEWEFDRVRNAMRLTRGGTVTELRTAQHRYRIRGCYAGEELAGSSTVLVAIERLAPEPMPDDTALRLRFGLTPREIQVSRLLAAGRRNDDVAASLQISPHTARRHTERVLAKLGASSRAAVGAVLRGA